MPLGERLTGFTVQARGFTVPLPARVILHVLKREMAPLRITDDEPETATALLTRWLRPFAGISDAVDYLERVRQAAPSESRPLRANPGDLPRSLDHLSYVLRDHPAWTCPPLVSTTETQSVATLAYYVGARDQFTTCMTALATVLARLNTPEPTVVAANSDRSGSLARLRQWLRKNIADDAALDRATNAIEDMRSAVTLRVEAQHPSSATYRNAARARQRLGLPDSIHDWAGAWDMVRSRVAEACDVLRQEVQFAALSPDPMDLTKRRGA